MKTTWSIAAGLVFAICGSIVGWIAFGFLAAVLLYVICGMLGVIAWVLVASMLQPSRMYVTFGQ